MALADLSQAVPFLLFLALFVLIGIYPAWQRTATIMRKFRAASNKPPRVEHDSDAEESTEVTAQRTGMQLDTAESIVFQRLVMNDGKSLSSKQINADLHLEPALLKTALDSLLHKGVLQIGMSALPIIRFQLTEKGRNYAQESGAARPLRSI